MQFSDVTSNCAHKLIQFCGNKICFFKCHMHDITQMATQYIYMDICGIACQLLNFCLTFSFLAHILGLVKLCVNIDYAHITYATWALRFAPNHPTDTYTESKKEVPPKWCRVWVFYLVATWALLACVCVASDIPMCVYMVCVCVCVVRHTSLC